MDSSSILDIRGPVEDARALATGFYAYFEDEALLRGAPDSPAAWSHTNGNAGSRLREGLRSSRQRIQNLLDNQALFVALINQGSTDSCSGLFALECHIDLGFESVIKSVTNEDAVQTARDFKVRLDSVVLVYDHLSEAIVKAAESDNHRFASFAGGDAEKAEASAEDLLDWAKKRVPSTLSDLATLGKKAKLRAMPYLVAMAYSIRVMLDARLVQSCLMPDEEREEYLEESCSDVEEFLRQLKSALEATLTNTSLLEIVVDLQMPLAIYLMLIVTLRTSFSMALSEGGSLRDIKMWDDGLSGFRELFCRKIANSSNSSSSADDPGSIQISSPREIEWWARFTNQNAEELGSTERRIGLYEFCSALGAVKDDGLLDEDVLTLRFKPGIKERLMQLPSADSLRSTVCAYLNEFFGDHVPQQYARGSSSTLALDSFARTSKPCRIFAMSVNVLYGHEKNASSVALCADGERLVSGSLDKTAKVWSVSRRTLLHTSSNHTGEVYCVAVSPDGSWAVSGSADNTVRIWTIDSGAEQRVLSGHTNAIWGVAVSPDGQLIASASGDKSVKLWNPSSNSAVSTLSRHTDCVYSVAFTSNSKRLVSAGKDNTLRIWSVQTGDLIDTINNNISNVKSVIVMPQDHHAALGCSDKSIKLCDLGCREVKEPVNGHDDEVSCVAVFPVGQRVASSSHDTTVRVNNLQTGEIELTLKGNDDFMWSVDVSRDGRTLVSGGKSGMIKIWSLRFAVE